MRSQLILFTTNFPYGDGESFIEPELKAICNSFERVFIVPCSGAGRQRPVPSNVVVNPPLWGASRSRSSFYLKYAFHKKTIGLVAREVVRAWVRYRRADIAVLCRIWLWAIYRCAFDSNEHIRKIISNSKDFVAYCFWAHIPALAVPTIASAGIPLAVRYHSVDLYLNGMESARWINRSARYFPWREEIEQASAVSLFVSDQGLQYFLAHWPSATLSSKVVARLGARGEPTTRSETVNLRKDQIAPIRIASCSAIVPVKRVPDIARLAIALARRRPVVWDHFGGGDDAEVTEVLRDKPSTLQVALHGHVENEELMRFYRTSPPDVFINLSTREGIPVAIMEALSHNIPVVATAVGGTPEAVLNGESGLLVDVDAAVNSSKLAEMVIANLASGGALDMSNPRQVWSDRFDADANAQTVAGILRGLAKT